MGLWTLDDLRTEVSLTITKVTGKVPDPARLDTWINFGYLNLASYVEFDELIVQEPFNVHEGVTVYPVPSDLLGVRIIETHDQTTDPYSSYIKLQKMKRPFSPSSVQAQPTHYKRGEDEFQVWREPDQSYYGYIEYVKVPTKLVAATDVTVVPAIWDVGLMMLGVHHGLLGLGSMEHANDWLGKFLGYKASRITEMDVSADVPQGGLNVAWDRDDISSNPEDLEE